MILTLEVVDPVARQPSGRARLRATGGTIGRSPASTLVLDDQHVSGQHALIHYSGGAFSIEDRSTNGVCLDSLQNKLTKGNRVPLKSGSIILIDPYEILVTIESDAQGGQRPRPASEPERDLVSPAVYDGGGLLPGDFVSTDTPARSEDLIGSLGLPGALDAPPAPSLIPPDWFREHVEPPLPPTPPVAPSPMPVMPGPAAPARVLDTTDDVLAAVLAGAGLDRADLTPELAENLGRILRVVVGGVMDVLDARQRTKEEFRVGVTRFQRTGNNPLKFSTSVEDALHNLLVKRDAGYLPPVEAFEDAFDDLRHHQVATFQGMRHAFSSMLSRFDPNQLQEQFDGRQKGALVSMPAGLRYWNLYRDWFRGMVGDVDASFRDLFGDEFAEAYEEQLRKLKAQGRTGASHRDEGGR